MKKDILLTPPKSLVRYPRATILTLYVLILWLMFTTQAGLWELFLTIPTLWLIVAIDNREEQRVGFFKCIKQLFTALKENGEVETTK